MSKPNLPNLPPGVRSVEIVADGRAEYREAWATYYTMTQMTAYAEEAVRQALAAQVVADDRDADAAEAFQMAKDDRATFPASTVRKLWELKERYRRALASAPVDGEAVPSIRVFVKDGKASHPASSGPRLPDGFHVFRLASSPLVFGDAAPHASGQET